MFIYLMIGLLVLILILRMLRPHAKKAPGPKGWPVFGIFFDMKPKEMHLLMEKYAREYGEIMSFDLLGQHVVYLNSERLIRKAFAEEPAKFLLNDRPKSFSATTVFNNCKSTATYRFSFSSEHDLFRKVFAKGLHSYGSGAQAFEEKAMSEIHDLLDRIDEYHGDEFDVKAIMRSSFANLASIFLRGQSIEDNEEKILREFASAVVLVMSPAIDTALLNVPFLRYIPGTYKKLYELLMRCRANVLKAFLAKQRNSYKESETRGFVDFLLHQQNNKENFVTDEIIEGYILEINFSVVTSFTTSVSSMILCLANHPEVQRKVRQEIQEVVGNDRLPVIQDKDKCPYIEAVFMETQRYISLIPFGGNHTNREKLEFEGFIIPKNSKILINLWFMHHNEKIWEDPWTFRPERFLDEEGQLLPRSHPVFKNVLPFGVGRRQCAGEGFARTRIFLYIASLLQRWTFIPSSDRCGSCDPRSDQFEMTFLLEPKQFFCRVIPN